MDISSNNVRGGIYFITQAFTANVPQYFKNLNSKLFHLFSATSTISVKLSGSSSAITLSQGVGFSYNDERFQEIEIVSAVDQIITFFYGEGNINDNRATVSGTISATIAVPNTLTPLSDVTLTTTGASQLSASSATKLFTIVSNPIDSVYPIRVGDNTVSTTKGFLLYGGQSISIDGSMAVYACNTVSSTQTISVAESKKV